jgi:molybdopterin converting factor small subunit
MRITVHYMAQIKRTAGCSLEHVETPDNATLRELLRNLADRHGASFRQLLLDDSHEPRKSLLYFVGDDHAELTRTLRDGDALTILAPMSGG